VQAVWTRCVLGAFVANVAQDMSSRLL
jgi:hypothetical protein